MSDFNGHEPPEGLSDRQVLRLVYSAVKKLERFIEGPTDERERGLVVRVDRLERALSLIVWLSGAAITAALGAIVTVVGAWIAK